MRELGLVARRPDRRGRAAQVGADGRPRRPFGAGLDAAEVVELATTWSCCPAWSTPTCTSTSRGARSGRVSPARPARPPPAGSRRSSTCRSTASRRPRRSSVCEVKRAAAAGQVYVDVGFWGGAVPGNLADLRGLHDGGGLRRQVLPAALRGGGVPAADPGRARGRAARGRRAGRADGRPRRGRRQHRARRRAAGPGYRGVPRVPAARCREPRRRPGHRGGPPDRRPRARPAPVQRRRAADGGVGPPRRGAGSAPRPARTT